MIGTAACFTEHTAAFSDLSLWPAKLAPQLEGMDKENIYEVVTQEIEEKLAELSEYSPEMFSEEFEGDADDIVYEMSGGRIL